MADHRENPIQATLAGFIDYAKSLKGDEKGEAQVFCDRLFQAFGHAGFHEAGATLEHRVKNEDRRTRFVDCLWPGKLLIEMKKRGEKLQRHYSQAFHYWTRIVPHRPQYVILCNFDEFWIYDFNKQLDEPMDRVALADLPNRYDALNFLLPNPKTPNFRNDLVAVTQSAADKVSRVFNQLIERESRELSRAHDKATAESLVRVPIQRFVLQCVIAMFSEDAGLLPKGLFSELLNDCLAGQSSYDLLGGLFRQMNTQSPARGGRFANVRYFNGGLFAEVDPIELTQGELFLLQEAAREDWSKVKPSIFGTLFQSSMGKAERHAFGAHYTSEADIQKVVGPTIVAPWRERIAGASTLAELRKLRSELLAFRVLDPACGSGNFLYVAFREMVRLEMEIIGRVHEKFGADSQKSFGMRTNVSPRQFHGLDLVPLAVELAKVTLMIGRQLALNETRDWFRTTYSDQEGLEFDPALPLDNLDENIQCADALFTDWPEADAIIGNPPFQSKNKAQKEMGPAYLQRIRAAYPKVPGRADFCVYWFHKAHQVMKPNTRAGLVGTNTIRQNYSREGSLDFIVKNGGTITDAVSSQVWSGDAVVYVSIVNWIKGLSQGKKHLTTQKGDKLESPWISDEPDTINSSLSFGFDVSRAERLAANINSEKCYQGQTHGHEGFLLAESEAKETLKKEPNCARVLFPYLTADEMLSNKGKIIERYVIDMRQTDVFEASKFAAVFERLKATVLPDREQAARDEEARNSVLETTEGKRGNRHHENFLKRWWQLSYGRSELIGKIEARHGISFVGK